MPSYLFSYYQKAATTVCCAIERHRHVVLVLPGWKQGAGYVTAEMIRDHLPASGDDSIILMCGPAPMLSNACNPSLDKLNYPVSQRFAY